jgi:hypothetical protein
VSDYRLYVLGVAIVLVLIWLLARPRKPKPPKNEAVTLNIVPGPIQEQGEEGDDSD